MEGIRCFIAVGLPGGLAEKAWMLGKELADKAGRGVKPVRPENMHLTLRFLGEVGAGRLEQIGGALERLHGHGRFEIILKGVGGFPSRDRPRVVWVGVQSPGLAELKRQVDSAIFQLGFPPEPDFIGHLTLARARTAEGQRTAKAFVKEHRTSEIGSFTAGRLLLKQSILTPAGPEYKSIRSVEL